MDEFLLNKASSWLQANGSIHDSCILKISDKSLSAGTQGELIVKVFSGKQPGPIKNCELVLGGGDQRELNPMRG